MHTVSVIVCTHTDRRLALLKECVDSLAGNTPAPHEIVVVVDSNLELFERLGGLLPAKVVLLASQGEGVSEARNTGVVAATGGLVAFIDDDAVADPGWLREIARLFDDDAVVAAGGRIVPRFQAPNRRLPEELYWVVGCTYAGHPRRRQPISRPIGCNMAARREALLDSGGFSPDFGPSGPTPKSHSNEEIALAITLRERYGQECIWYTPDAVVHHFVPEDRITWGYLWHRCVAEGVSKADVRARFGSSAMGFDRNYARTTLVPAIGRYAWRGIRNWDGVAAAMAMACVGGLFVTATAYLTRLTSQLISGRLGAR